MAILSNRVLYQMDKKRRRMSKRRKTTRIRRLDSLTRMHDDECMLYVSRYIQINLYNSLLIIIMKSLNANAVCPKLH